MFEKTNMRMQSGSARLHSVRRDIEQLLKRLIVCFVKPPAYGHCHIMDVNVDSMPAYNIKPADSLYIGGAARSHLAAGIDPKEKDDFIKNVLIFYKAACRYIVTNINTKKEVLWKHAEVRLQII